MTPKHGIYTKNARRDTEINVQILGDTQHKVTLFVSASWITAFRDKYHFPEVIVTLYPDLPFIFFLFKSFN